MIHLHKSFNILMQFVPTHIQRDTQTHTQMKLGHLDRDF